MHFKACSWHALPHFSFHLTPLALADHFHSIATLHFTLYSIQEQVHSALLAIRTAFDQVQLPSE